MAADADFPSLLDMKDEFQVFSPPVKAAPAEGETYNFHVLKPEMELVSECMWSAGRLGHMAKRSLEKVTMDDMTFQVEMMILPATQRIENPSEPGKKCLWPVFFRGKLARDEPTFLSLKHHMESNPMGHVSRMDKVSWFATDPATALNYGYPDVYTIPAGRTLRLLNVGDPKTVEFIHKYYAKHHDKFKNELGNLAPTAATTAFILNRQHDHVDRGTEWTADTHVSNLLAQSQHLLADLKVDGWALDWTSLMHTELMILNAYPKLKLMGSIFGHWGPRDTTRIRQRHIDLQQLEEHIRRKELKKEKGRRFRHDDSDDDNNGADKENKDPMDRKDRKDTVRKPRGLMFDLSDA